MACETVPTRVEWTFESIAGKSGIEGADGIDGFEAGGLKCVPATNVKISYGQLRGSPPGLIKATADATEEFALVPTEAKSLLEHGVRLR
jgi:hypothetical protein